MLLGAARLCVALAAALCCCPWALAASSAGLGPSLLNSNAIKNLLPGGGAGLGGSPGSAAPADTALLEGGNKHQAVEPHQPYTCSEDEDCAPDEFCSSAPRGAGPAVPLCLACRKRRKRCLRHAMCCPGNYCNNGICVPSEQGHFLPGEMEETIIESFSPDHGIPDLHPKRTTSPSQLHHLKGQESTTCLRSSDCAAGLCCARHFWSKICKPVLKEGQVCTKHRRKGSHGLEIFQRCYCGEGLSCRLQRDYATTNTSRLHTCQRH
ncbi:dickkopf-related protein 1 [Mauremys mutica]|uniref:dickkopf-related protein 1 n=1 Tax=Mauremys mutica TaxID=74926 RepID=UPI001D167631|nr:dickkopf-related protein 1 [Mauremys mutica]